MNAFIRKMIIGDVRIITSDDELWQETFKAGLLMDMDIDEAKAYATMKRDNTIIARIFSELPGWIA